MKITKFPQSCILIETKGKKILLDPGIYSFDDGFVDKYWKDTEIILITHKHQDHCNLPVILDLKKRFNAKVFTTKDVSNAYPDLHPSIVKEGDVIKGGEISIEVVHAVHGYNPHLKCGKMPKETVGYIIDDGSKRAYHTGDTICFENDYKCDVLFAPINGHGLCMHPFEAGLFSKELQAKLVIPFHYESPMFPGNLDEVKKEFDKQQINYKILKTTEQVEI